MTTRKTSTRMTSGTMPGRTKLHSRSSTRRGRRAVRTMATTRMTVFQGRRLLPQLNGTRRLLSNRVRRGKRQQQQQQQQLESSSDNAVAPAHAKEHGQRPPPVQKPKEAAIDPWQLNALHVDVSNELSRMFGRDALREANAAERKERQRLAHGSDRAGCDSCAPPCQGRWRRARAHDQAARQLAGCGQRGSWHGHRSRARLECAQRFFNRSLR